MDRRRQLSLIQMQNATRTEIVQVAKLDFDIPCCAQVGMAKAILIAGDEGG